MNYRQFIDLIVDVHDNKFFSHAGPIASIMALFRLIEKHPNQFLLFVIALKSRIEAIRSSDQRIFILHLIELSLIAFPNIAGPDLFMLLKLIKEFVAEPAPVSSLSSLVGTSIVQEYFFPGVSYFRQLQQSIKQNPIFEDVIPLFYHSKNSIFEELMENSSHIFNGPSSKIISFVNFYLRKYLHSEQLITIEDVVTFFQNVSFDPDGAKAIASKLQIEIQEKEPEINTRDLLPPLFQFQLNPITEDKFLENYFYSKLKSAKLNEDRSSCQSIFVIGKNSIITTVLKILFSELSKADSKTKSSFEHFHPIFYLVPWISSRPDSLSNFLSRIDPIYERFVLNPASIVQSFVPLVDNQSAFELPSIVESSPDFLSHEWFTDPNPFAMYRFVLQHYALTARFNISLCVWCCEFKEENAKAAVTIPFVINVFVGGEFYMDGEKDNFMKLSSGFSSNLTYERKGVQSTISKIKLKGLAIFNFCPELEILPTSNLLGLCFSDSLFQVSSKEKLPSFLNKFNYYPVSKMNFESINSRDTFRIKVDGVQYGPISSFSISRMVDPLRPTKYFDMQVATFTPTHF